MNPLQNKNILLGVTGGIAAYKSPDVVRRLQDLGAEVRVVMTESAQEFIGPLSLQAVSGNRVHRELLDEAAEAAMGHIELARWADAIVIAPTTAATLSTLASGGADDLLTTLVRACTAPVLIAPAMNQAMWADALTQRNVATLIELGYSFVGPASGSQACGDVGEGRMSEAVDIAEATGRLFKTGSLQGVSVVITAGPTREPIDPVRYISNYSSGKMGFSIAQAAAEAGADVHLICGPVSLPTPEHVKRTDVQSAQQMYEASLSAVTGSCVFIATAAVADFRCVEVAPEKIKKTDDQSSMTLELEKTPDILAEIACADDRPSLVVGFAAESENVRDNAHKKLFKKNLDMIIANDISRSDIGFGAEANEVLVLQKSGAEASEPASWGKLSKAQLGREIIALIASQRKA